MKKIAIAALVLASLGFAAGAQAKGCLKGAAAGAVAGHFAHHTILGALGGCVAGHEAAKIAAKRKKAEEMKAQQQGMQPANLGAAPSPSAAVPASSN